MEKLIELIDLETHIRSFCASCGSHLEIQETCPNCGKIATCSFDEEKAKEQVNSLVQQMKTQCHQILAIVTNWLGGKRDKVLTTYITNSTVIPVITNVYSKHLDKISKECVQLPKKNQNLERSFDDFRSYLEDFQVKNQELVNYLKTKTPNNPVSQLLDKYKKKYDKHQKLLEKLRKTHNTNEEDLTLIEVKNSQAALTSLYSKIHILTESLRDTRKLLDQTTDQTRSDILLIMKTVQQLTSVYAENVPKQKKIIQKLKNILKILFFGGGLN